MRRWQQQQSKQQQQFRQERHEWTLHEEIKCALMTFWYRYWIGKFVFLILNYSFSAWSLFMCAKNNRMPYPTQIKKQWIYTKLEKAFTVYNDHSSPAVTIIIARFDSFHVSTTISFSFSLSRSNARTHPCSDSFLLSLSLFENHHHFPSRHPNAG